MKELLIESLSVFNRCLIKAKEEGYEIPNDVNDMVTYLLNQLYKLESLSH